MKTSSNPRDLLKAPAPSILKVPTYSVNYDFIKNEIEKECSDFEVYLSDIQLSTYRPSK